MFTYQYPRPALTTDAIVYVKEKEKTFVLLIERGKEPFKNKWALPGGFVDMDELLKTACKRELLEETGLVVEHMTQFGTYDALNRDPRHRTISVIYYTELAKKQKVKGGDDALKANWFSISELPQMAFDHLEILNDFFGFLHG